MTEENVVNDIFYQDEEMRCMYDKFTEMLFVDATYKLNDLRMFLSKREMVRVKLSLSGWWLLKMWIK